MRKLIAEGVSLRLDIVPGLAEVARFSKQPRWTLKGLAEQIRRRHERRLAGHLDAASPPNARDDAAVTGLHWTRQTSGAPPNFELESLKEMAGNA
jgi:hypothetical protein